MPDIVTDQTFPDPLKGYVPAELSLEEARALRKSDPGKTDRAGAGLGRACMCARCWPSWIAARSSSNMATACAPRRRRRASRTLSGCGSFVDLYIRPLFCQGIGPFRWIAVSGDPQDIYTIDDMILRDVLVQPSDFLLDQEGARACPVHGLARPHRLARLWRAQPAGADGQRGRRQRHDLRADRLHPRSSRFRLGGDAPSRDREHERRVRRHRRLANAERVAELLFGRRSRRDPWSRRARGQRRRHDCRRRHSGDRGATPARARRRSRHRRAAPCRCRIRIAIEQAERTGLSATCPRVPS